MTSLKILFVCLTVFLFISGIKNSFSQNSSSDELYPINSCPAESAKNRGVLEEFLTEPQWSDARQETHTEHLDTSQITLLKDAEDGAACAQFNNQYEEAFT